MLAAGHTGTFNFRKLHVLPVLATYRRRSFPFRRCMAAQRRVAARRCVLSGGDADPRSAGRAFRVSPQAVTGPPRFAETVPVRRGRTLASNRGPSLAYVVAAPVGAGPR